MHSGGEAAFTSWLCLVPGNMISVGKILPSKTLRPSGKAAAARRRVAVAFGEPETTPSGFCRRLPVRIGYAKAIAITASATVNEIAALFCDTQRHGVGHLDPDAAYKEERCRQRVLNNLTRLPDHWVTLRRPKQPDGSRFPGSGNTQISKMDEPVVFRASRSRCACTASSKA